MNTITHPRSISHDATFYTKQFDDGRFEVSAFFGSDHLGWAPMIAVWSDPNLDPATTNEDVISLNGMIFAYCISDQEATDFEGLVLVEDPSDLPPTFAFAIGALLREAL